MSDRIPGPPKTVQQSHNLRIVRRTNLNEQRSDEKRHLAELEERMRRSGHRKSRQESEGKRNRADDPDSPTKAPSSSDPRSRTAEGHIDFTA